MNMSTIRSKLFKKRNPREIYSILEDLLGTSLDQYVAHGDDVEVVVRVGSNKIYSRKFSADDWFGELSLIPEKSNADDNNSDKPQINNSI